MDSLDYYFDRKDELNLNKYDFEYLNNAFTQDDFDPIYLVILNYKLSISKNLKLKDTFRAEVAKLFHSGKIEISKYWGNPLTINDPSIKIQNPYPIVLFTYNRLETLQKTVDSLLLNQECIDSELFIFSDGPNLKNSDDQQKVNSVREYIEDIKGFKSVSIYKNKENFGLEKSVTNGLNKISSEYEAFIILEDDLILSPYFLNFMNYALKTFQKDNNVWSINGMSANKNLLNLPENFFESEDAYWIHRASSHGWGSWSNRWNSIELEEHVLLNQLKKFRNKKNIQLAGGDLLEMFDDQVAKKIDSWAIKWVINVAINKGLCLTPVNSFVSHQFSVPGRHIKARVPHLTNELLNVNPNFKFPHDTKVNELVNSSYNKYIYFQRRNRNIIYRLKKALKNLLTTYI